MALPEVDDRTLASTYPLEIRMGVYLSKRGHAARQSGLLGKTMVVRGNGMYKRTLISTLAIFAGILLGTDAVRGGNDIAARAREAAATIRKDLIPLIQTAQQRFKIPGMSIVLVRGGDVLWSEGFGLADVAAQRAATADTLYRAGSLAKPLTAIAVMQLAEKGRVDIDQPLTTYLPAFSIRSRFDTSADPITVRSVLAHHGGLPTDLTKGMWTDQPFTVVATKLREEYTCFPPNLVFSYSNVGYTLLGHLVQKVSGMPYSRYMERLVMRPLGMRRSIFRLHTGASGDFAKGYRDGREMVLLPIRDLPAAGLSASAADLGRFMQAMLTGRAPEGRPFLEPATLKEMLAPQNENVDLDLDLVVGLGWFLEKDSIPGGGITARHGGTTLGFSAEMILLPEKGLGVAVLANGDGSRNVTTQLAEEILTRILAEKQIPLPEGWLVSKLKKRRGDYQATESAGTYATDLGLISIRPRDAELCACMVDETLDLIPYPDGWLGVDQSSARSGSSTVRSLANLRFRTERIDGHEVIVAQKDGKRILLGEKVPAIPVPEIWRKRVGHYKLLNPDPGFPLTEPQVEILDGQLCMSYKLPLLSPKVIQVPLQPISDTEAIILGLGRMRGETLRAVQVDGEEHLRYSGFEGRQLDRSVPAMKEREGGAERLFSTGPLR
jgi:CubicO group peptidase (beta-lactamase class C family)